jgi:acyl carrier protein
MSADPAILAQVQALVAEVLACESEEAAPKARFFKDLGGESLDILDLTFRCEKQFGVKLGFEKMLAAEFATADESGVLAPQSLVRLKEKFAFLDLSLLGDPPNKAQLADLLTVETIAAFIEHALAERDQQPALGQG